MIAPPPNPPAICTPAPDPFPCTPRFLLDCICDAIADAGRYGVYADPDDWSGAAWTAAREAQDHYAPPFGTLDQYTRAYTTQEVFESIMDDAGFLWDTDSAQWVRASAVGCDRRLEHTG